MSLCTTGPPPCWQQATIALPSRVLSHIRTLETAKCHGKIRDTRSPSMLTTSAGSSSLPGAPGSPLRNMTRRVWDGVPAIPVHSSGPHPGCWMGDPTSHHSGNTPQFRPKIPHKSHRIYITIQIMVDMLPHPGPIAQCRHPSSHRDGVPNWSLSPTSPHEPASPRSPAAHEPSGAPKNNTNAPGAHKTGSRPPTL